MQTYWYSKNDALQFGIDAKFDDGSVRSRLNGE